MPHNNGWILKLDEAAIAALSQSLRKIDPNYLKSGTSPGKTRIWYQGKENYFDVMAEMQDNQIDWFQFTLRGKSLIWNRHHQQLRTGITNELDVPPDVAYYAASKTIKDDQLLNETFIDLVKSILKKRPREPLLQEMLILLNQKA
ncbi:MAG: hypothetical protein HC886_02435 [Leptolyngbyaceae cyanobacterium SM1_1_3]|nr:hypothetical protein [Leptolyngbyaceae cyanobacterium SM1_1_3]NJN03672.1 hypothetical protein [Leptolyngbyaceae cyanobacterium RM1_1_2]NJO09136.1 hypothetical protein [Leptolyngbyaceae cyanobacterium SL_1_1]